MKTSKIALKTVTFRLAPQLYRAAQELATQRDISLNSLMQQSLAAALFAAEGEARYKEYTLLGQDPAACDMSFASAAQAEVMLRDER